MDDGMIWVAQMVVADHLQLPSVFHSPARDVGIFATVAIDEFMFVSLRSWNHDTRGVIDRRVGSLLHFF